MKRKLFITFPGLICILFYQNCSPTGFESNKLNTIEESSSQVSGSESESPNTTSEADRPMLEELVPEPIAITPELPLFKFSELNVKMNQSNQVVVSWKQNFSGTGQVMYGKLESEVKTPNIKEEMNLTYHTQIIRKELEVNTTYYFKAVTFVGGKIYESIIVSLHYKPNISPPVMTEESSMDSLAEGDIAKHCDETKPLCGIMYGLAISSESYGHTRQYKHSASIKFQAEKTGKILAYKHLNRVYRKSEWDRDDNNNGFNEKYSCKNSDSICKMKKMKAGGYHMGNGGLLRFAIHPDNGKGEPAAKPIAYGKKTIVPTRNKHYVGTYDGVKYYVGDITYEHVEWDKPVNVQLGRYYHIVIRQLEPKKGLVVLDGFRSTEILKMPGGPYYGQRFSVVTKGSESQAWRSNLRIFPDFKIFYADGVVAGGGNEGVGGEYSKYKVRGKEMLRQVFTMDYNAEMSGLWVRLNRKSGKAPLIMTVKNSDGSVVGKVNSPSTKVRDSEISKGPNWVYNKFSAPIFLVKGRKYFVEFKTSGDGYYLIPTEETYDYREGIKLSKESVWKGAADRAEFSTNGENSFKPVPSSIKDLPILFTISGKPDRLK